MTNTVTPNKAGGTYVYRSLPRAVGHRRKYCHYREEMNPDAPFYANLMFDPRVIRGSTYAMQSRLPVSSIPEKAEIQRQLAIQRRSAMRRQPVKRRLRPVTPQLVEENPFVPVRTSPYLQEIVGVKEEAQVGCQTDQFKLMESDDCHFCEYKPLKSGIDAQTQIYEGELFKFEVQVKPMLEVLVGKTVEQALLEVMEEEELAMLRSDQLSYREIRNAELVEQQRLEEKEQLLREEKERRIRQMRAVVLKQKDTAMKLSAHIFCMGYLADLVPTVFQTLTDIGYFYDPVERDVEFMYMPLLMTEMTERVEKVLFYRYVLDRMIREVVDNSRDVFDALDAWEMAGRPGRERKEPDDQDKIKKPKPKLADVAAWWIKMPNMVLWWKDYKKGGKPNRLAPYLRKIPVIVQKPPSPKRTKEPSESTGSSSSGSGDSDDDSDES